MGNAYAAGQQRQSEFYMELITQLGNAESIGNYEYSKSDQIGEGAFGVVYRGCHRERRDLIVAIKCISLRKIRGGVNQVYEKEIRILKELHHQNIVQLFECKISRKNVYLVMEYCNRGDLSDYLEKEGPLSEETIRIFLRQIASAMTILHAKEIMHRDLKPQNLLLCHTNSNPKPQEITIKIADFGLSRFLYGNNLAATVCGTPFYMAPEVLASRPYDASADLWSIGAIVFECLAGEVPFKADTYEDLCNLYKNNKNLVPQMPPQTSNRLSSLILGLLKLNMEERISYADLFNHPFLAMTVKKSIAYKEVVWESISHVHNQWFPYDPLLCQSIENAYQRYLTNASSSSEVASRKHCLINLKNMEEMNSQTNGVSPIRRLVFQPSFAAANQICWQWNSHETTNLPWSSYPADVIEYMEQNFQESPQLKLDLSTHFPDLNYTIDFAAKKQTNNSTQYRRSIKQVVLSDIYPVEKNSKRQVFTFVHR